jgi:hypothetical protein
LPLQFIYAFLLVVNRFDFAVDTHHLAASFRAFLLKLGIAVNFLFLNINQCFGGAFQVLDFCPMLIARATLSRV